MKLRSDMCLDIYFRKVVFEEIYCTQSYQIRIIFKQVYLVHNRSFKLMSRVFTNGPGDLGSILSRVIPKTQKMGLDATLLSTHQYKVRIKGKIEETLEWSSSLP